jgi:nicotinamide riboside transporter PnuC
MKKKGSWKKNKQKKTKKRERESLKKKKRNAQWITVVIHSVFGCGEIVISPHHLVKKKRKKK